MARMHARQKGKASSTRPYRNQAPEWLSYDKKFVSKKVEELRRQGQSTAMIGVILRDQYGVPNVKEALVSIRPILSSNFHIVTPPRYDSLYSLIG